MNYKIPGSIFDLVDQSAPQPIVVAEETLEPLYIIAVSSDKGPEEMRVVKGDLFFKLYGRKISFARHGQPLLQAAQAIENGGRLLIKRVVAIDSTLANLAVIAKVTKVQIQKRNANNDLLFKDAITSADTIIELGNTPIMIDTCSVSYECKSVVGAKDLDVISALISQQVQPIVGTFVYPLFVISDNGRGVSLKKFRVTPDYNSSKSYDYCKYMFTVLENNAATESIAFSADQNIIENPVNTSIQSVIRSYSNQVKCKLFESDMDSFVQKVAEFSGNTKEYLLANDILFGMVKKGNASIPNLNIDKNGANLSYIYGLELTNGSDGNFGVEPFGKNEYFAEVVKFFDGTFTSDIYDMDNYKIDCVIDANYSAEVKRAIETFVTFREDCEYIKDFGIGVTNLGDILNIANNPEALNNEYIYSNHLSYDIIDPYTKKQISVTIGYTLSRLLISHFIKGRNRPLAGQLNGMTIPEAIEGTVNFIPKVTPVQNQKDALVDARVNYATYYDNILTIDTLLTSQEKDTQLSFVNNMFAVQEVIKAIRTRCPKTRYSFIDGEDFTKYKEDVDVVINKFTNNFEFIEFVYLEDPTMVSQKVFYAALNLRFRNWVQTEYFKIYALA